MYGLSRTDPDVASVLSTGLSPTGVPISRPTCGRTGGVRCGLGPPDDDDGNDDVFPAAISTVPHDDDAAGDVVCAHGPRDLWDVSFGESCSVFILTSIAIYLTKFSFIVSSF